MINKITIEISGGTEFMEALRKAKQILRDHTKIVEFEFNSVKITLSKEALKVTDDDISAMYFKESQKVREVVL